MSVGALLGGRYELLSSLGHGGFGTVWRAHDRTLGRDVAVKLITLDTARPFSRTEIAERFEREARAVAGLNHPNVVTAHDYGVEGDTAYLVMELITGGSLDDELAAREAARDDPLDADRVIAIGAQIAAGLAAAHAAGLIHRDLKPANVMIAGSDGVVKIVDFGIARVADRSRITHTGVYLGTLRYTAPEQMGSGQVDPRADLYSLGCLLFELLTGRSPYQAETPLQWIAAHQYGTPAKVRAFAPLVPAALESLIDQTLAKSPDARPASAAEVRARLIEIGRAVPGPRAVAHGETVVDHDAVEDPTAEPERGGPGGGGPKHAVPERKVPEHQVPAAGEMNPPQPAPAMPRSEQSPAASPQPVAPQPVASQLVAPQSNRQPSPQATPPAPQPSGQPSRPASLVYPAPGQPSSGYASPGHPSLGYPNPGYPNPGYPNPGYPNPGYPNPGYPNPGYPNPGYAAPGYPTGARMPAYPVPTSGRPAVPVGWQVQYPAFDGRPPRSLFLSAQLLRLSAALSGLLALFMVIAYHRIAADWHAAYDRVTADSAEPVLGLVVVFIGAAPQIVGALLLARSIQRGHPVGRVLGWIFIVLNALCCLGAFAGSTAFTPPDGDFITRNQALLNAAHTQFSNGYPVWLTVMSALIGVLGIGVLVAAAVTMSLRSSRAYFGAVAAIRR